MTRSIADRTDAELGGSSSVLVRQRNDHIRLDGLLYAIDAAHGSRRQELINDLCRLVFPHAFAEESVLWPALRRMLPDGEAQTTHIEIEHQQINELFTTLESLEPDSVEHRAVFADIARLLREDVRDEEDHLFPELREAASDRQLRRMGLAWSAVRRTAPTRPHPVVARRPPGNALAALPLTVLDRARDNLDRLALRTSWAPPERTSRALATLGGRVERIGPLRRGEREATHVDSGRDGQHDTRR